MMRISEGRATLLYSGRAHGRRLNSSIALLSVPDFKLDAPGICGGVACCAYV